MNPVRTLWFLLAVGQKATPPVAPSGKLEARAARDLIDAGDVLIETVEANPVRNYP